MFSAKLLNGWRLVFTMALVKPETAASVPSNGAPSAASTLPSNGAPSAAVSLADRLRPLVASNGKFRWRKIATLAGKVGATEYSVKVALRGLGAKLDRTENLVKVGSIGSQPTTAPTAPAPDNRPIVGNDFDDEAEDDDFNEDEDGDEESDLEDEAEDEDNDDESDLEDEPVESFVPAEGIVSILRGKLDSPNYRWRKLPTLAQSAGLSESATRQYLEHIGARESRRGGLFRL